MNRRDIASTAIALLGSFGCAGSPPVHAPNVATPVTVAAPPAAPIAASAPPDAGAPEAHTESLAVVDSPSWDATLAQALRDRFTSDPILRAQPPSIEVSNGLVTLSGSLSSLAAQKRAEELVGEFMGPQIITDRTVVTVASPDDVQLAEAVTRALQQDRATRAARVNVAASNGAVTVTGTVDSWTQRQLVGDAVDRVRGVRSVDNAVTLFAGGTSSDAAIAAEVRDRITDDGRLDGARVTAEVGGRDVRLRGLVASIAQRLAAIDDAWVAGVANVDPHGLAVDWRLSERAARAAPRPNPGDRHLATAVGRILREDPRVGSALPSVAVKDGVVTLTGDVNDIEARQAAVRDAEGVADVRSVHSRVRILPAEPEPDARVEETVKRAVLDDLSAPDSAGVQITTSNGKVTLRGNVASLQEKQNIEADAMSVTGVVDVANGIVVQPPSDAKPSLPTGEDLRSRVAEDLFWDPRVESGTVSVAVAPDRSVTLTGAVQSWNAAREAEADAIRAGAARVENRLGVAGRPSSS